jgi:hypothetical protein
MKAERFSISQVILKFDKDIKHKFNYKFRLLNFISE